MTRLNNRHDWLPAWPYIWRGENKEYVVEGKHITFERYLCARWLLRLVAAGYFILLWKHEFKGYDRYHWGIPFMIVLGQFVAYALLITIFPLPRWLCWLFLRRHTRIRLSREHIIIDGKTVKLEPDIGIQFYVLQPPEIGLRAAREHFREGDYLMGFHAVNMVFLYRPWPIASFDSEARAAQFVSALQFAYGESQS